MGGKTLRFPKRQKFVAKEKVTETEEKEITSEEHEARLKKLKELGLI